MRYCSLDDLQLAMPAQTLIWLSNDDPLAKSINEAVVDEAVRQAEELVDAYLRGRYLLPLATVPTVVKDITVYLARHWLYVRRPEGRELPEAVTRTYANALQMLSTIRDGLLSVGLADGNSQPEPGEMKVCASAKQFGSSVMERYGWL